MIDRMQLGDVPPRPHTAFRSASGDLRHEDCFTRLGFDGELSILYHEGPLMTFLPLRFTDQTLSFELPGDHDSWVRRAP